MDFEFNRKDVWTDTMTARKYYTCSLCGMKISPGTNYTREYFGNHYNNFIMHTHCIKLRNVYKMKKTVGNVYVDKEPFLSIINDKYKELHGDNLPYTFKKKNFDEIFKLLGGAHSISYSGPERLRGTMKGISLPQPWPELIQFHGCDVITKKKPTKYRGKVLIFSSSGRDRDAIKKYGNELFFIPGKNKGGYIGIVEIYDCIPSITNEWYKGSYGYLIKNFVEVDFVPAKGRGGVYNVDLEQDLIYI